MHKQIEDYLTLPYTIEMVPEPEGGWFVSVRELPGCMSEGDTPEEAIAMIQDAMRSWIEVSLEDGDEIPVPRPVESYSGKFVVRVPRSLHRELVAEAEREGVSLNQYIAAALARCTGELTTKASGSSKDPSWPMLKSSVSRALCAAGLAQEAGELDEQLFAARVEEILSQIESALQGGYYRDCKWTLSELAQALHPAVSLSPVVKLFYRTVCLLQDQIEPIARCQQGIIDEVRVERRITHMVRDSALARQTAVEARNNYDPASMEPPAVPSRLGEEAENPYKDLFSPSTSSPDW